MFSIECRKCQRLAEFLDDVRAKHPEYFGKPVPSFGDPQARLLIVGLAPGMHGANATGRPFTGDYAGILLYETLHKYGFSNQAVSEHVDDGLALSNCRITNAVRCLPPGNKPTTDEVKTCNPYLKDEIASLKPGSIVLALGGIAHSAVMRALGLKLSAHKFGHAAQHVIGEDLLLVDSYHCSRYNTQTRRLTPDMFRSVFHDLRKQLDETVTVTS